MRGVREISQALCEGQLELEEPRWKGHCTEVKGREDIGMIILKTP